MDVSYLLDSLNDKQREAVAASRTNMLVLAGAGSGKTRVLVHRIAWLLSVENCSPYSIMAVTFTNKAAAEMRHRIGQLMGTTQGGMWVGTFHGLCNRLLRAHGVKTVEVRDDYGLSECRADSDPSYANTEWSDHMNDAYERMQESIEAVESDVSRCNDLLGELA